MPANDFLLLLIGAMGGGLAVAFAFLWRQTCHLIDEAERTRCCGALAAGGRCIGCGHRQPAGGVPPRQTREQPFWTWPGELAGRWRARRATMTPAPGHEESATPPARVPAPVPGLRPGELDTLNRIARRPAYARDIKVAREAALRMRRNFPDVADADLGRAILFARWLTGTEYAAGQNLMQIGQLLGLVAVELTEAARVEHAGQVQR